jgi:hypothetical protein
MLPIARWIALQACGTPARRVREACPYVSVDGRSRRPLDAAGRSGCAADPDDLLSLACQDTLTT